MKEDLSQLSPAAQRGLERLDEIALHTDVQGIILREFLSPANIRVAKLLIDWMRQLGMEVCHTLDGSVRGILPGSNPEAKPLLVGSHFDSVRDAGKYDGPLGLITALAAIEELQAEGITLPYPLHVLGFSDEEGVRFHTAYLGSRSMVEDLDEKTLAITDHNGVSLAYLLATEGWRTNAEKIRYQEGDTRGYIEVHIEQGRVLEELNLPVSAVSNIVGQTRLNLIWKGRADHAGTTPMEPRYDALVAASECVLAAEKLGRDNDPAVLTVGKMEVKPGSVNAIPGEVVLSVDIRHPEDSQRAALKNQFLSRCDDIAKARNIDVAWQVPMEKDAVPCDESLSQKVLDAVEEVTGTRQILLSGAGHDGVAISKIAPIAMIFVRCREGLSHHPDEYSSPEDVAVAIRVLKLFLEGMNADE